MNMFNKKSLFLFLLLSTTAIVPVVQAGIVDTFTSTASAAYNSTRDFAVQTGSSVWNYAQKAPKTIKTGDTRERLKLGGIVAATVATPFVLVYLIKKMKAKSNSGKTS